MRCVRFAILLAAGLFGASSVITTLNAEDHGGDAQWRPDLHWRLVGPFRGGRTRAATGVPGEPNVFYVGQVNGGVWKTTDYGRTWSADLRPPADAIDRGDCGGSLGQQHRLCSQRRRTAPAGFVGGRRDLQIDRCGENVAASWIERRGAARRAADSGAGGGSAGS